MNSETIPVCPSPLHTCSHTPYLTISFLTSHTLPPTPVTFVTPHTSHLTTITCSSFLTTPTPHHSHSTPLTHHTHLLPHLHPSSPIPHYQSSSHTVQKGLQYICGISENDGTYFIHPQYFTISSKPSSPHASILPQDVGGEKFLFASTRLRLYKLPLQRCGRFTHYSCQ